MVWLLTLMELCFFIFIEFSCAESSRRPLPSHCRSSNITFVSNCSCEGEVTKSQCQIFKVECKINTEGVARSACLTVSVGPCEHASNCASSHTGWCPTIPEVDCLQSHQRFNVINETSKWYLQFSLYWFALKINISADKRSNIINQSSVMSSANKNWRQEAEIFWGKSEVLCYLAASCWMYRSLYWSLGLTIWSVMLMLTCCSLLTGSTDLISY